MVSGTSRKRTNIPRATQDAVLKEYNHRCAMCGTHSPHLHHMDENPSNHDPFNLLPLCPNCHLNDQHNPTTHIELGILQLFRRHRDPAILSPQFAVLYAKFKFALAPFSSERYEIWDNNTEELTAFVKELKMGDYYSRRIKDCLEVKLPMTIFVDNDPTGAARGRGERQGAFDKYSQRLPQIREEAVGLIMELLRFQDWQRKSESSRASTT